MEMAIFLGQLKNYAHAFITNRIHSFARASRCIRELVMFLYRFFSFRVSPFWIQLCYFVSLALLGSLAMMVLKPDNPAFGPRYVDMLFMSVSALTVSGLGTVEMENFSSSQIVVLALLMFLGGDVLVCLLGLLFRRSRHDNRPEITSSRRVDSIGIELDSMKPSNTLDNIELGRDVSGTPIDDGKDLMSSCIRYLGSAVLCFVIVFHVVGCLAIFLYIILVSSARDVLKRKGINNFLFSIFTTISSFANGGLISTNENMLIFNNNPGLYLIIIPQILGGNLLFPLCLRLVIWALRRLTKAVEFEYMLKNPSEIQFGHLRPDLQTLFLSLTCIGFIAAMVALFCSMDWTSAVFQGLNSYEKLVSALFMAVNSRHSGENSIDISLASPSVIVLFILMMYLPPSVSFVPIHENESSSEGDRRENEKSWSPVDNLLLSQLSSIVIFIIMICITERKKLTEDPLNFSTLNVIFEVTSGYGNVGLSMGYSCSRFLRLHPDAHCLDRAYSFSGAWSDEGKLILAIIMLYGRLKNFTIENGKAWQLL
ncbi:cation transporter HKT1-like [Phoenix dactylifera]|uniref:Cation transporter HKT1-like n=1 Tax=Phoenix dactylifera TaxID=42345 RepID=A0A8B7CFB8_PHODC|nr:cation transporter HKT1-like [Phoenix dactylifera]